MLKIILNIRDNLITDQTKNYILTKLQKLEEYSKFIENINVDLVENSNRNKNYTNFNFGVLIKLPKALIKVEQKGTNVNSLIDKSFPILARKIKRYSENFDHKSMKSYKLIKDELPQKIAESDSFVNNIDYQPVIVSKFYEDDSPMHPAEAIERMELLGHSSFLFKNIKTSQYCMVYKDGRNKYCLVQPKS